MRTFFFLAALTAAVPLVAADAPPTSQPAVTTYFPGDRRFTYRLPAGWQSAGGTPISARYSPAGGEASILISLMPAEVKMTDEFHQQVLKQYQDARQKAKTTTAISPPAMEPDDRFALKLHERYTYTDAKKATRTSDEMLLARVVSDRVVTLSVKTVAATPDAVKAVQKEAEEMLLSVATGSATPLEPVPAATAVLGGGLVTYSAPPGWQPGKTTPNTVSYVTAAHDGILAITLLPSDAAAGAEAHDAILNQLKSARKRSGAKVVLEPTVEPDDRFILRVHERYEVLRNDKSTKVADQLHLYRALGGRVVMLTVNTVADESGVVKATQKDGEEVLLSAQLRKPGTPKGK